MQRKRRKKVGRPIAYKGDPNASNLTEADRRRIKRRIANRESARRVRARRQGTLEELQVKVCSTVSHVMSQVPLVLILVAQLLPRNVFCYCFVACTCVIICLLACSIILCSADEPHQCT